MTTRMVAVRLPEATVDELDRLVAEGRYGTRSDGIKDALEKLLAIVERTRIDDAIIAAYERMPLTAEERGLLDAHARLSAELLDDEDW